ncbi:MAG: protein-tyrosine phosphatase family protein [Tepidiformaceae bacterium]
MTPWWIECPAQGRLAVCPRPRGGDWLADDLAALRRAGVDVLVSALTPAEEMELGLAEEPMLAEAAGLRFVLLPTGDFGVPRLSEASGSLLELRDDLAAGQAVVAHCRMGVGRSPLIVASLLVATGLDPGDAWARVEHARGLRVPDTEAQRQWVSAWAEWLATSHG